MTASLNHDGSPGNRLSEGSSSRPKSDPDRRALSAATWTSAETLIRFVTSALSVPILARVLSPSDFGMMAAAGAVVEVVSTVAAFGVPAALVQRQRLTPAHVGAAYIITGVLTVIAVVGLFVSAPWLARLMRIDGLAAPLRVLSLILVARSIVSIAVALKERELQYRPVSVLYTVTGFIGTLAVPLALASAGLGYWALVVGAVGAAFLQLIVVSLCWTNPLRVEFSVGRRSFSDLLSYGGGHVINNAINQVALTGDNLVVGRVLGAAPLGLYTRAYQLMSVGTSLFNQALGRVFFASLARLQQEPERARDMFHGVAGLVALIGLPAAALLSLFAEEAVEIALGPQWRDAVPLFRVLAGGLFLRTAYNVPAQVIRAAGHLSRLAIRQIVYALAVIGGAAVGSQWGLVGVAWAITAVLALHWLSLTQLAMAIMNDDRWWPWLQSHAYASVAAGLVTAAAWAVCFLLIRVGAGPLLSAGLASGVSIAMMLGLIIIASGRFGNPLLARLVSGVRIRLSGIGR